MLSLQTNCNSLFIELRVGIFIDYTRKHVDNNLDVFAIIINNVKVFSFSAKAKSVHTFKNFREKTT